MSRKSSKYEIVEYLATHKAGSLYTVKDGVRYDVQAMNLTRDDKEVVWLADQNYIPEDLLSLVETMERIRPVKGWRICVHDPDLYDSDAYPIDEETGEAPLDKDGTPMYGPKVGEVADMDGWWEATNERGERIMVNPNGKKLDFEAALMNMDDDLREELHMALAPCSEAEFFAAYADAHRERFGEEWELAKDNPVW